jgi:hypothetical protein
MVREQRLAQALELVFVELAVAARTLVLGLAVRTRVLERRQELVQLALVAHQG